jgi:NAD(P)-dependent dehydrogenase (short-subunit alcohol dehydrogenase family)
VPSSIVHRSILYTSPIQHCYVTGGSTGLGLALAIILTKRGADVSIVARNEERLKSALNELEVRLIIARQAFSFSRRKSARHPTRS